MMRGRLIDLTVSLSGKQRLTIELDGDFRGSYDKLRESDIAVEVKKYRERRSKDANAYFHVLVTKIAEVQGLGLEEVKKSLVLEYGTLAKDKNGVTVGFKLPSSVNIDTIYPYAKVFDVRMEDNVEFNCYLVFKHTHELDTKEFTRLIDGAIYVAKDLGIETDTPEELAKQHALWERTEQCER